MFQILDFGSLVLTLVRQGAIVCHPLWLGVGGVGVERTGTKITQLQFNLQMVNEVSTRLIRVDGVTVELPELEIKEFVKSFEGRLENRHWLQSWPLHLDTRANLTIKLDVTKAGKIPQELLVKVEVKAPRGIRRKKVIKKLVYPI